MIYRVMGAPKSRARVLSFFFLWSTKRDRERGGVPRRMRKSNIDMKFSIQAYARKKRAILSIGPNMVGLRSRDITNRT